MSFLGKWNIRARDADLDAEATESEMDLENQAAE
jgi:hypothetical protein